MLSAEQRLEIDKKMLNVVQSFLISGGSIEEVSKRTGISSSSVQRYLNNPRIIELLGIEIYDEVQEKLQINTLEGRSRGGVKSTNNNIGLRAADGRFIGNRKR